jgi:hypothetical protein
VSLTGTAADTDHLIQRAGSSASIIPPLHLQTNVYQLQSDCNGPLLHCYTLSLCKKILGIPRFAANRVAEIELGRDSRRAKVLCLAVKYWLRTLQMDKEELIRVCFEWQVNNLKFDSWASKLSEQLSKIGRTKIYLARRKCEHHEWDL